jgi:hypothetical protein|tara:strand:+ start:1073 stop:1222 length:150 start_codon:yes stop_codon:yes gene_type:complete
MRTQADVLMDDIKALNKELLHARITNDVFSQIALYDKILEKQSILSNIY